MTHSDTGPARRVRRTFEVEDEGGKLKFYRDARDEYQRDLDADRHNIMPAREDMQFVIGDQWDVDLKNRRQRLKKPTLTVNRLPAFIAQYLGSWQQTDTTMNLLPMQGGSKRIAEIRKAAMRTIVTTPIARHAQYTAMESSYICGVGNFGVELVESEYDVFAKDFQLVALEDPFQIIWDRSSSEPTGRDAQRCYVMHWMTKPDFKEAYPKARDEGGWTADELDYTSLTAHGWEIDDMIRVCHFWQMKSEPATVALEEDTGDVIDVTGWDEDKIKQHVAIDDQGELIIRETTRPYAECYVLGGAEVLDGPFRLNIDRVPYFRVEGWKLKEASVNYRWGFVRNAKDPQRLHNYWRSILAEELMKSPASKWLLDQTAMKSGLADAFRNAHLSGDNVLFWDSQSDGAKPEFVPPPPINAAVMTESQMTVQDIKDVTNKHEASLGVTSNEVSGKAINARQRVSELGDRIYLENMNMALAECARVMNQLFPEVYDTNRVLILTDETDKVELQEINGIMGDETPDITVGKYHLTYTTGPSYATKREEATETMLTLMNHMPQMGNYLADIIARNMDIPGAEEIEERLAMLLPPGMLDLDRIPERRRMKIEAQQEEAKKQQQVQQQMQNITFQATIDEMQGKIAQLMTGARLNEAKAAVAEQQVGVDSFKATTERDYKEDEIILKAAEIGVKLDESENKRVQMGMDAAFRVDDAERKDRDNGGKTSEGGQQGPKNDGQS